MYVEFQNINCCLFHNKRLPATGASSEAFYNGIGDGGGAKCFKGHTPIISLSFSHNITPSLKKWGGGN